MAKNKMQHAGVKKILEKVVDKDPSKKYVSYSQYSVWKQCPYRWNLTYKEKLFPFTSSIETVFGTAIHESVQHYLTLLYTQSIKASNDLDIENYFSEKLMETYIKEKKANNNKHFSTLQEITEYLEDGIAILKYLKRKRVKLFDTKYLELVGVEIPLRAKIFEDSDKFFFEGYLDIVFYDTFRNVYIVPDFKSSKAGWGDYQKKSELKMAQLRLYKKFFSEQFDVPLEEVEVEFIILKRKVPTLEFEYSYELPRSSKHIPTQGEGKLNTAVNNLREFIFNCFYDDGTPQEGVTHLKLPSSSNCKFCPYNNNATLCDKNN